MNILGFLEVYGKSKDTLEARRDMWMLAGRQCLQPEKRDKGRDYLKPASYNLSKEKESMFD